MVHQTDYGTPNDKTLVPGSLRVFRHFGIDGRAGLITPMNYAPAGSNPFTLQTDQPSPVYRPGYQMTHRARCSKGAQASIWFDGFQPTRHPAPEVTCTCGFYAHYKQATDFYGHVLWGAEYQRDLGREAMAEMVVCRAVCEVSGTTVMGRLGVRAEKMEIKAIAVDWSKFRDPRRRAQAPDLFEFYRPGKTRLRDYDWELRILRDDEPDEYERLRVSEMVEAIAAGRYGVTFYDDWREMYREHPEADVSALGVEDAPTDMGKPNQLQGASPWGAIRADIQRQAAAYAKAAEAARDMKKTLAKLLDIDLGVIDGGKPKQQKKKPKPGGSMPEHIQAALEAKQNRKAPPGTGIDRRRGRLK